MPRKTLFRNALLADVGKRRILPGGLLVQDGTIVAIGEGLTQADGVTEIDLQGLLLAPGLIDMHVHLREPGLEHKETIASGTRAAAAGGFTTICTMPNTNPVLDSVPLLQELRRRIERSAVVKVLPIAAISLGSRGQQPADFTGLQAAGAVAFSDDGKGVMSSRLLLQALRAGRELDVPIIVHEEDHDLAAGGNINAGPVSKLLGDPGIPGVAEYAMVARDIYLAELADARLHVAHVSCSESVALVRRAKQAGLQVTAEVTPHHLVLTDGLVPSLLGQAKVNPPLRSEADRQAVCRGLADGAIDVVATDHAPHAQEEKELPLSQAAFGFSGLESAFAVCYQQMVQSGAMSLIDLLRAMTIRPAEILGLSSGRLQVGCPADLVVLDLDCRFRLQEQDLISQGKNTPFLDKELVGRPLLTMVAGEIVMDRRASHVGNH